MSIPTSGSPQHVKKTPSNDRDFDKFVQYMTGRVQAGFARDGRKTSLFHVQTPPLFEVYLDAFPDRTEKQHNNCRACADFLKKYGDLVFIGEDGEQTSALWDEEYAPPGYHSPIQAMRLATELGKVSGVFYPDESNRPHTTRDEPFLLGSPVTNGWNHFAVEVPSFYRPANRALTASQAEAEKAEDYKTVGRALSEFSYDRLVQVVSILESDALYRSEHLLGAATWLRDLAQMMNNHRNNGLARRNLLWRAVAAAPAGFCHPRSGMLGTLLADLEAGLSFAQVKRNFEEKMHPLKYQRPTAPPKEGTLDQAEKLVETLGLAPALARRFLRLSEVPEFIWRPAPPKTTDPAGVFGHLREKPPTVKGVSLPATEMTWDKFRRTVLPAAEWIQFYVTGYRQNYTQLTTAVNLNAPPILQWDDEDRRNPVAWYGYYGGATPASFGLRACEWVDIVGIIDQPTQWGGRDFSHQGESVTLLLEGAVDCDNPGLALFPEFLKSELHGVRSVIEAHSKTTHMVRVTGPVAAGYRFHKNGSAKMSPKLRVRYNGMTQDIVLDRWD